MRNSGSGLSAGGLDGGGDDDGASAQIASQPTSNTSDSNQSKGNSKVTNRNEITEGFNAEFFSTVGTKLGHKMLVLDWRNLSSTQPLSENLRGI